MQKQTTEKITKELQTVFKEYDKKYILKFYHLHISIKLKIIIIKTLKDIVTILQDVVVIKR